MRPSPNAKDTAETTGSWAPSLADEIANSVTHGVGLLASLAAAPVLIVVAARGDAWQVVGSSVFAATLVAMYAASTLYHALRPSRAKRVLRVLDHGAIYLLIAGTYTPFTLGVLRGAWGWALLGLVWGLAVAGVVLKSVRGFRHPRLSTAVYLLMGWLVVIAIKPMITHMPLAGLLWLLAGGLSYTGGIVFYAFDHRRYVHAIWHLFVLGGSTCHVFAVLLYSARR
ncbi:MAG: hemolysin III family protein [Gemmatimonadales bacterium]